MAKKIKHKFKKGDPVLICHSEEWPGGGSGIIADVDLASKTYTVVDITTIRTTTPIDRWVNEANLILIPHEVKDYGDQKVPVVVKPKFFQRLKWLFGM